MIKKKTILIFCVTVIVVFCSSLIFLVYKYKNNATINTQYVKTIESELYDFITVYNYNEHKGNYECSEIIINKDYSIESVFYYYSEADYDLINYEFEENVLILNVLCQSTQINQNVFQKMKLSYKSLGIKEIIINYKNNITID